MVTNVIDKWSIMNAIMFNYVLILLNLVVKVTLHKRNKWNLNYSF